MLQIYRKISLSRDCNYIFILGGYSRKCAGFQSNWRLCTNLRTSNAIFCHKTALWAIIASLFCSKHKSAKFPSKFLLIENLRLWNFGQGNFFFLCHFEGICTQAMIEKKGLVPLFKGKIGVLSDEKTYS